MNLLAVICEVTHRCPLHCVYCSNPLELKKKDLELPTAVWTHLFSQAASLGALQLHLTGGEPLAREDIEELVRAGHSAGLYTNLITSGLGLKKKIKALVEAGLDHVQLSFQDADQQVADKIAGTKAHEIKIEAAQLIKKHSLAFTINIVVHRQNLDRLEKIMAFAEDLSPDKIEVAHTQYYGWAFQNRNILLPTPDQIKTSVEIVEKAQKRLKGKIRVDFVVPDYFAKFPKPCMGGWGRQTLLINPSGEAMPCHSAHVIPNLRFDKIQERDLQWIWNKSEALNKFRGEEWMDEPCRSCDRRTKDYGGCRCQAFLVTQNERTTDPVCSLSPDRPKIDEILKNPHGDEKWIHRKLV